MLPPAALAVHQLRYYLAYGSAAGAELQRTGHSYLHSVVPWIVLLVALVCGGFLVALGRAVAGHRSVPRFWASLLGLWLACSACLVAIFVTQEFLEGLFATGHPTGLVGIFGFGGWWSIPGGVMRRAGARGGVSRRPVGAGRGRAALGARAIQAGGARGGAPCPSDVLVARLAPLAEGFSGRGPPVLGSSAPFLVSAPLGGGRAACRVRAGSSLCAGAARTLA